MDIAWYLNHSSINKVYTHILVLPLLYTLLEDDPEAITEYGEIIVIFPLQTRSYTDSVQTAASSEEV